MVQKSALAIELHVGPLERISDLFIYLASHSEGDAKDWACRSVIDVGQQLLSVTGTELVVWWGWGLLSQLGLSPHPSLV